MPNSLLSAEQWIKQLVEDLGIGVIAIDGKTVKGSYERETAIAALHLVSAWATDSVWC